MNIFEHSNYRTYLKLHLRQLPNRGRGELTKLAKELRVDSSLLSQIFANKKDFTVEQAFETATYLGLGELERDYFVLLVQIERAGTKTLRDYFRQKLLQIKNQSLDLSKRMVNHQDLNEEHKVRFYSSWIYAAIQLFTSIGNGKSLSEIEMHFELPREETRDIMTFLVSTGLNTQEGGIYRPGVQKTHLNRSSFHLTKHHTNWRLKSLQRLEKVAAEELVFTSPLSISTADFLTVREKLTQLIQDISKVVSETTPEQVAFLNIDFLKLPSPKQSR